MPSHQVPERMAAKSVTAQQDDVDEQHQGPDAHTKGNGPRRRGFEPERLVDVPGEEHQKQQRQVHEIAMTVLKYQRQASFTPVGLARLADRAGWRIGPESLVVCPAVVVAGEAKSARPPKDQQGRREDQPARPHGWFRPEPAMLRVAEYLGRI